MPDRAGNSGEQAGGDPGYEAASPQVSPATSPKRPTASKLTDGSLRVFEGTYTIHDGTIVAADIREVTGPEPQSSEASPYYENCDDARAAGAAPIHEGEPGYAPHLDRDGDGVACEQ